MRDYKPYTLISAGKVRAIVDSTNASPINVQVTGHGFASGDRVTINGHLVNTAANGTWLVTKVNANNFTLDGSTGNGVGGATGCAADYIKPIYVIDYRHLMISIATDGGGDAAMTVKCVGTIQDLAGNEPLPNKAPPDFAAARSVANNFDFIEMIDKQSAGTGLPGDTGFVVAAADDYRVFEVNTNGLAWLSFLPTAGTEGEITIKIFALNP